MIGCRMLAAAEIGCLAGSFWFAVWGADIDDGVSVWNILASAIFFSTIAVSTYLRKPGLRESGFRFDNFKPAIMRASLIVMVVALGLVFLAQVLAVVLSLPSIGAVLGSLTFGIVQQALFLGYLFHRWNVLLRSAAKAALANSLLFGILHVPDIALVMVATGGELLLSWLFMRERNVWAAGFVHGALALVLLPFLLNAGIMQTPRIGPPALASFAEVINRLKAEFDRIGLCSKVIGSDQLGPAPGFTLQRVLRGANSDRDKREKLAGFFGRDGSALCITTEREFYANLDPTERARLVIVARRYIWRNWKNQPHFFEPDPVLGLFRDLTFLIANRRPPMLQ